MGYPSRILSVSVPIRRQMSNSLRVTHSSLDRRHQVQGLPRCGVIPTLLAVKRGLVSPLYPSHDNTRLWHRLPNRLVGQHTGSIEVEFIINYDILTQHSYILHAHPLAHTAAPAHDA